MRRAETTVLTPPHGLTSFLPSPGRILECGSNSADAHHYLAASNLSCFLPLQQPPSSTLLGIQVTLRLRLSQVTAGAQVARAMAAGRLPDASFETTRGAGLQPLHLLLPVMRCGTGYLAA